MKSRIYSDLCLGFKHSDIDHFFYWNYPELDIVKHLFNMNRTIRSRYNAEINNVYLELILHE